MDRRKELARIANEASICPRCGLARTRTQVVFGEGNPEAKVMIVGQGPGEQEDKRGHPFIGPAGELLNRALAEVGLRREELWVTNVTKCRATRVEGGAIRDRPPSVSERRACRLWLDAELRVIRPRIILCLGAPAAQELIDKKFKISQERGQWREGPGGARAIATFHPAYILRLRSVDPESYGRAYAALIEDLRKVAEAARE